MTARWKRWVWIIGAVSALLAVGASPARQLLSDDDAGMTCQSYLHAAHLAWRKKGGDWVDAAGKDYGDVPFASATLKSADAQPLRWDVTTLVQSWLSGAEPNGAMYLRSLAKSRGQVDFHSRESPVTEARPALVIEWSNGTESRLAPLADTWLSCAGARGKGEQPFLRIGRSYPVVLVFPVEARAGLSVRRAQLLLTTTDRPGPAEVGVYRLVTPASSESKVEVGLAAKYPGDRGIERDPKVFVATGFEGPDWLDGWSGLSRASNVDIVGNGHGNGFEPIDGKALEVTIKQKTKMGLNTQYRFARHPPGEPEEAYFRYYLRFGDNWAPREGGKLPGFSGTYNRGGWGNRRSDGTNGWSARGRFGTVSGRRDSPVYGRVGVASYVYHVGSGNYGDGWRWNLGPTGLLQKNRWYSIEQHVKLNQPDRADGEMRAWVDGKLVLEKTGIRFRTVPELRIESLWMNVYHGGLTSAPKDISLYMDNLVIARQYIGPMTK